MPGLGIKHKTSDIRGIHTTSKTPKWSLLGVNFNKGHAFQTVTQDPQTSNKWMTGSNELPRAFLSTEKNWQATQEHSKILS